MGGTRSVWHDLGAASRRDELDRWQQPLDPAVKGRPWREAYPVLSHSGRSYDVARETTYWEWQRVWDRLGLY